MCQCRLQEELIYSDDKKDDVISVALRLSALYGSEVGTEGSEALAKVFKRYRAAVPGFPIY